MLKSCSDENVQTVFVWFNLKNCCATRFNGSLVSMLISERRTFYSDALYISCSDQFHQLDNRISQIIRVCHYIC